MKKFLLLASLLSLSAQAVELKVVDMPASTFWGGDSVTTEFGINESLGRAWLNTVSTPIDSDLVPKSYRTKVAGLTFDVATKTILLNVNGQNIDCATLEVRGWGIFKSQVLIPTGRCELVEKYVKVSFDNGYEVQKETRYQVTLIAE